MLYLHLKPLLQQLQLTVNSFRVLSWIEIYSSCADLNKIRDRIKARNGQGLTLTSINLKTGYKNQAF
jgi:hypothetical protein